MSHGFAKGSPVLSVNGQIGHINLTTTNIPEGTNLYYTEDRVRGVIATMSTSDLPEGSNLYYTEVRARTAVSSSISAITYTSSTGVFSLTGGYVIPTTSQESAWTAKEEVLSFSSGLTRAINSITCDLITGKSGGQTIYGSTLTTEGLNIQANIADDTTGAISILTSTASSGYTNGALIVAGGVGIAKDLYVKGAVNILGSSGLVLGEDVTAGSSNVPGKLKFWSNGDNAYSSTFTAGIQSDDVDYTLPTADGTSGNCLSTNGAGVLSWASILHNNRSDLQGGTPSQYYHLTSAQHTNLTGGNPTFTTLMAETGTAKATTNHLIIAGSANAVDMDGTESRLLFKQKYYDAGAPAYQDAGGMSVITESDWTSTASTRTAALRFYGTYQGNMATRALWVSGQWRFIDSLGYSWGGTLGSSYPYARYHFYGSSNSGKLTPSTGITGFGINTYYNSADSNRQYTDFISYFTTTASTGGSKFRFFTATRAASPVLAVAMQIDDNQRISIGDFDPTAHLHLKAGTATASTAPLKFTAGTLLTTPESGTLEYDQTFFHTDYSGLRSAIEGCLFSQTATQTITNTTDETTVFTTGVGTLTIPANSMLVGRTIRVKMKGTLNTTGVPTTTLKIKFGSVTLISSSIALPTLATASPFDVEFDITCRTTGATGTIYSMGRTLVAVGSGTAFIRGLDAGLDTIDTTIANTLDATYQWDAASTDNILTLSIATVEVLY